MLKKSRGSVRKREVNALLLGLLFSFLCPLPTLGQRKDSTVIIAAGAHYLKNAFHRFWWGEHYRRVWAEPVEVNVIWLEEYKGGVIPVKQGGSFQTSNLRLQDSLGRQYVLRSINKDPTNALPAGLRKTFVAKILRDQTSVIHPYGAFIVPILANAAQVYHTNPKLVYIPDDPALGIYRKEFANTLALLEERPDEENWADLSSFGNPKIIVSSKKAFENLVKNPDHQVAPKRYLRSRLFDMWLSDWSRREDQWRWGVEEGEVVQYEPIPRDRDHAFFKFNDGLITGIFSMLKPQYQSFDHSIVGKNVKGLIRASRQMDAFLLAYLSKEEFIQESQALQKRLTDEVIDQALQQWPKQIRELSAKEFKSKLTARRNDLPNAAEAFYRLLKKEVKLPGSDEEDIFFLQLYPDGSLKIELWSTNKGEKDHLNGQITFYPSETKSIALYGLGDSDVLHLSGNGKSKIKISWYGGQGADKLQVADNWKVTGKKIILYDEDDSNDYEKEKNVKIKNYVPKANEFSAEGWLLRHRLD